MPYEKPASELARLRKEQSKTLRDEIFGGLSLVERAEYDRKAERIHVRVKMIEAGAAAKLSRSAKAKQGGQWNKDPETDTPRGEPRQTYRSRERDSGDAFKKSRNTRGKAETESDEKGNE